MGLLFEAAAGLFAVTFVAYCAGFSTPNLLYNRGYLNGTQPVRLGLWTVCRGFGCRSIFEDNPLVSTLFAGSQNWFYVVQGLSVGGFALACLTIIFLMVYFGCLHARGLGLIKAMIITLIPSAISQGAGMALFLWKCFETWMKEESWAHFTFDFAFYIIVSYVGLSIVCVILLILYHRQISIPAIFEHEHLVNET